MLRFRLIAAVAVAIGLLAAVPARAQSNATLSGTVTDAQNAVMPGVSITVHNSATEPGPRRRHRCRRASTWSPRCRPAPTR